MISFIISAGLFVIGSVALIVAAITAFWLLVWAVAVIKENFLNTIIAISTAAGLIFLSFGLVTKYASADSLDVGYFSYINQPQIETDKSNMSVGYTADINRYISVKAGILNNANTSLYMAVKGVKSYSYIDLGISTGFMPNIETKTTSYLTNELDDDLRIVGHKSNTYTSTTINESAFFIMPSITTKFGKHAIEFGYIPKLHSYEESRVMIQYQLKL